MRALLRQVVHSLERGQDAELVTVLASAGSTPRGTGAVLAVFPDGTGVGTVGGGNVEYEAQKLASKLLETGENALRDFRFVQGDAASLGMVCGGDVTLHFHYLDASDSHTAAVFRALLDATAGSADTWLIRKLDGAAVTAMGLADRTGTKYIENVPTGLLESRAAFREGWFISLAAAMCPRRWCPPSRRWASARWSTMTARSSPTPSGFPGQRPSSAAHLPHWRRKSR